MVVRVRARDNQSGIIKAHAKATNSRCQATESKVKKSAVNEIKVK